MGRALRAMSRELEPRRQHEAVRVRRAERPIRATSPARAGAASASRSRRGDPASAPAASAPEAIS